MVIWYSKIFMFVLPIVMTICIIIAIVASVREYYKRNKILKKCNDISKSNEARVLAIDNLFEMKHANKNNCKFCKTYIRHNKVICNLCNGSKFITSKSIMCPRCKAHGFVFRFEINPIKPTMEESKQIHYSLEKA